MKSRFRRYFLSASMSGLEDGTGSQSVIQSWWWMVAREWIIHKLMSWKERIKYLSFMELIHSSILQRPATLWRHHPTSRIKVGFKFHHLGHLKLSRAFGIPTNKLPLGILRNFLPKSLLRPSFSTPQPSQHQFMPICRFNPREPLAYK